jgi:hypothetical protein
VNLFGAFQPGLAGDQVLHAHRRVRGVAMGALCLKHRVGGLADAALGAQLILHGAGQRLLGGILVALAKDAHALEGEPERGTHGPSDRPL